MDLAGKAQSLLLDAEVEIEALERRRQETIEAREAEIREVRERFQERLNEIERSLGLAARLRKALDPEGAKREAAAKRAKAETASNGRAPAGSRKVQFKPSVATIATVFAVMAEGIETVPEISERVPVSRGSVENVIAYGRDANLVRLIGTTKASGGKSHTDVRRWRLTPEGEEFLSASRNEVASVAAA